MAPSHHRQLPIQAIYIPSACSDSLTVSSIMSPDVWCVKVNPASIPASNLTTVTLSLSHVRCHLGLSWLSWNCQLPPVNSGWLGLSSLHQGVLNSKDENSGERFDMLLNISYNTLLIGLVLLDTGCRHEIFIALGAPMTQTQVTHSHHPWFSLILQGM